ncbi:hypothetical protein ILYODFUR_031516 [Ilyodon furcidens]|uniref:Uncharacterized protein n=1 Tax=Ilyodon furcidens TaxID=33524 RepID=A0ABV0TNN0_9TELE
MSLSCFKSADDVVALYASDISHDLSWCRPGHTYGCILRQHSASLFDIIEKFKEISQEIRERTVDLCTVWFILGSNFQMPEGCLKVQFSSVQTFICKYESMGMSNNHTVQKRDKFCFQEIERTCFKNERGRSHLSKK